jgi:hypothetical protein
MVASTRVESKECANGKTWEEVATRGASATTPADKSKAISGYQGCDSTNLENAAE